MHATARRHGNITSFGQALQVVRTQRGLSHQELSDRVGHNKATIRDWEANVVFPNTMALKRLYASLPNLRHFTYLMPPIAAAQYMEKAAKILEETPRTFRGEATSIPDKLYEWLPPAAARGESLPEELESVTTRTFGEHLKFLRLQEGMDRSELAELLNVTNQAVLFWEDDENSPILDHFTKLLTLFPQLRDGPQPMPRDIPKPDNRVNGYVASTKPLRAVPTAFDTVTYPPPALPAPESKQMPPAPAPEPQKTTQQLLAEAGAEYANLISEKTQAETKVIELEVQLEDAKKALVGMDDRVKAAHQKIVDIATKF